MNRIIKDYEVRRTEILDMAQKLFFRKGFEQTSIQDIISKIGIAKGTFYHYFSSKMDLLDGLIERMLKETLQAVKPVVDDNQLNAPEKFERFFTHIESWQIEHKDFFLEALKAWHKHRNAIFRQKIRAETINAMAPILTKIIHQGVAEGVFETEYPDDLAEIVLQIAQSLSETAAELLLDMEGDGFALKIITRKVTVHEHAIERVLGASPDSLKIFNRKRIKLWFE